MLEFLDWVGTLVIVVILVGLFSAGISFWKAKRGVEVSSFRASTKSALLASGSLALVPIVVVLVEGGFTGEFVIVSAVVIVGALFMAAVVGFPVAHFVFRKFGGKSFEKYSR